MAPPSGTGKAGWEKSFRSAAARRMIQLIMAA